MQERFLSISTPGAEATLPPVRGRVLRSRWLYRVLTFLTVFGPGLLVMEADNDAGAVSTYVQAGAQYGTRLFGFSCCCCRLRTLFRRWWYASESPPARVTPP